MSGALSKWTETIGVIAVVISLLFVAFELQQSNRIAVIAAYQNRISEIQELNQAVALSGELATILEKLESEGAEALDPIEFRRARAWHSMILRGMQGQYYQYQHGFLDRVVIDHTLEDLDTGIYQQWKALNVLGLIEIPEWQHEIDSYINRTGD